MWAELKTMLWLQVKLTGSMFRSRRTADRLYLAGLLSRILMLLFSLPVFVAMGCGLAIGLALLPTGAAYELAMLVNSAMFFVWLLLPASYSSQIVERFEISRLFPYPIRFGSIVLGSVMISLATMTGIWTVLVLAGEIVGLAWHKPLALPLIALGAVPTLLLLVLAGRIMEDMFDLVAGDRRLRALALGILSLPFVLCWLGQYAIQYATKNYSSLSRVGEIPFLQGLSSLGQARTLAQFLEMLAPSRVLIWLPPGWATAGMAMAAKGLSAQHLLYLLLSTGSAALMIWMHAGITRRLTRGASLRMGAERVRAQGWWLALPGPPAFWATFRKDWTYLWRSPLPRRLAFSALVSMAAVAVPLLDRSSAKSLRAVPLIAGAFVISLTSMIVNLGLSANYFGTVDREGFATLAASPLDRRLVILSANLTALLFVGAVHLLLATTIAALTRNWLLLPLGMYLSLCMQIGAAPAYTLAAIIGPYRAQLRFSGGRQRGNMWGVLAWLLSAAPLLALLLLPYLFWRPGLAFALPLGPAYSLGLYLSTLKPLARLLRNQEHRILQAVTSAD